MTKLEMYENIINNTIVFGNTNQLLRIKIETLDFDFDFRRDDDGSFQLVGTKAVVRVLGKTTKVPLGETHAHQTHESAYEATRQHWSDYFKDYRDTYVKTATTKRGDKRRQKRYREQRREREETIQHRP